MDDKGFKTTIPTVDIPEHSINKHPSNSVEHELYYRAPCIGTCSTTYGDAVCRGCRRYSYEIVHWNRYSLKEKQLVWNRLEQARVKLLRNLIVITDRHLLAAALNDQHIAFHPKRNPYWSVYELLRRLAKHSLLDSQQNQSLSEQLEPLGLQPTEKHQNWTMHQLYQYTNQQLYDLAVAEHSHQHRLLTPQD